MNTVIININKQDEITKRQMVFMANGLYKLGKYRFNRAVVYER